MSIDNRIFITASCVGSYYDSTPKLVYGGTYRDASIYGYGFVPDSFDWLNYHIYEPITGSENILGWPLSSSVAGFKCIDWSQITNGAYNSKFIKGGFANNKLTYFNTIMNRRNGSYQWPMWKQLRNADHPLVKYQIKNCYVPFLNPPEKKSIVENGGLRVFKASKGTKVDLYTEPYLVSSYGFLVHGINEPNSNTIIELKNTYGNNISYFSNSELNNKLNLRKTSRNTQIYDVLKDAYKSKEGDNAIAGQFKYLKYSEGIYPKDSNTYLEDTRGRKNYEVKYWRENRDDRNLGSSDNSQGNQNSSIYGPEFALTQSRWPLDARKNYKSDLILTASKSAEGELQNNYTTFFRRTNETGKEVAFGMARVGALYNRRWLEYDRIDGTLSYMPYINSLTQSRVICGDTEWTALKESGKRPFDETYDKFAEEIRRIGKEFSVIPEFRISDHMEYFIDKENGNFLAEVPSYFSLTGASIIDSGQSDFFTTYSNSDFLKFFEVIKSDHSDVANVDQVTLKCEAIMKLNAYDGFYPVNRTLQLATLFSQSYGDYVIEAGYTSSATSWPFVDTNRTKWRSFLTPFFAPGILYNSIKSGMAVDFPIYTENPETIEDFSAGQSSSVGTIGSNADTEWYRVLKSNFSKRIPFEGLLEPENYVSKNKIWDMEPEWSASLRLYPNSYVGNSTNQAALWGGQGSEKYKLAMHNFLAEVPDFFLEDSNFSTFTSYEIPSDGITINPQQATSFYGMDIYVTNCQCRNFTEWVHRKSSPSLTQSCGIAIPGGLIGTGSLDTIKGVHTVMYSNDEAFGPAWVFDDPNMFLSGRPIRAADWNNSEFCNGNPNMQPFHYSYEPFTPAYFNGFGLIRLLFYPFKGPGKYTLDEIQLNLTSSYIRMPTSRTGAYGLFMNDNMLRLQTVNTLDVNVLNSGHSDFVGAINAAAAIYFNYEPIYTYTSAMLSASMNWQQLSSSINFLGKTKVKKIVYDTDIQGNVNPKTYENTSDAGDVWVIQPKWETPILNFYNKRPTTPAGGYAGCNRGSRGMWHQYGDYCTGSEGIWFGISDLPDSTISSSLDNSKYRTYKGSSDLTSSINILEGSSENIIKLKKENAQVQIIINDLVKIWNFATCSIQVSDLNFNLYSYSYGYPSTPWGKGIFRFGHTNAQFAKNLTDCINSSDLKFLITASTSVAGNFDDMPVNFTGSDAFYGHTDSDLSPFSHWGYYEAASGLRIRPGPPAIINLKFVNREVGYSSYPNYLASGDLGNKIICSVTSGFGFGVNLGFAQWVDKCTSSEGWAVKGADYTTDNLVFAPKANFYGGVTRDYKVKSLADLLGFEKTQKRMGKVAKDKIIKEAVVAIPYIEENNEKKYFSLSRKQIDLALNINSQKVSIEEMPGESIIDMVNKMQNYVFPPRMDFLTYNSINPFIMYIFEFTHTLSQRDLYDIWQGLQPDIGRSFQKQTSVISHKIKQNEFFGGNFPSNVRWMVFKVKQKAAWNYFAKTADTSDDDRFKFNFNIGGKRSGRKTSPNYNYNWPYDQFSLVELVKIGAEVDFKKKE